MRDLTKAERTVIEEVARRLPKTKREQLLMDLERATVDTSQSSNSRVLFHISGYERPSYKGQHSFGVTGVTNDLDGARLDMDVYADENDRLLELDIVRSGAGRLIAPNWDDLTFFP